MIDFILFLLLAAVAIASAAAMLISQNAIYSALFLVMNFAVVAMFYLILGAPFIAMAQVTVYAGAIMVLFLFVIMLLGTDRLKRSSRMPRQTAAWQRPLAFVLGGILLAEAAYVLIFQAGSALPVTAADPTFASPAAIGALLYNEYLLPFEITSLLLLVAMVGAIVLTRSGKDLKS
jgi:NADH-quinone oxidoreductase subunit J